ncbi:MAG: hypothetical protein KAI72_03610, partial [Candidatus Pacebacteria bacterium]|nr:hypothetical protein [Candidatus Paceibacterota bacterium]
ATSLRNNDGGRGISTKSRDSYRGSRGIPAGTVVSGRDIYSNPMTEGEINLDRELKNIANENRLLASLKDGGIRTAGSDMNSGISERLVKNNEKFSEVKRRTSKEYLGEIKNTPKSIEQNKPKRKSSKPKYYKQKSSRSNAYDAINKKSKSSKKSYRAKTPTKLKRKSSVPSSKSYYAPNKSSRREGSSSSSKNYKPKSNSRSSSSKSYSSSSSSRSRSSSVSNRSSSSRRSSASSSRSSSSRSSSSKSSRKR